MPPTSALTEAEIDINTITAVHSQCRWWVRLYRSDRIRRRSA